MFLAPRITLLTLRNIHVAIHYNPPYTPYKGLNWAKKKSRKLGVFAGSWMEATPHFIVILIDIGENNVIMVNKCLSQ